MKGIPFVKMISFVVLLLGTVFLWCGCSFIRPRVSLPSYTLLKEYQKDNYPYSIPANGPMGQYIVLNNNLQTYLDHGPLQEEIGIWRMRGDTLFLEPQLVTTLYQNDPGIFHRKQNYTPRQFLMTKKYAYDITDYWQLYYDIAKSSSDSSAIKYYESLDSLAIVKEKEWIASAREVYLIMQRSESYKYQRDFDW